MRVGIILGFLALVLFDLALSASIAKKKPSKVNQGKKETLKKSTLHAKRDESEPVSWNIINFIKFKKQYKIIKHLNI